MTKTADDLPLAIRDARINAFLAGQIVSRLELRNRRELVIFSENRARLFVDTETGLDPSVT